MSKETFFRAMNRGQYSESEGLEGSAYCIFTAPVDLHVTHDNLRIEGENMILELVYGFHWAPGVLRLRQMGSNVVLEESPTGQFQQFLADKQVKYLGQLVMYALQFKIQDLSACIQRCTGEMKQLEDQLDNCLDNQPPAMHRPSAPFMRANLELEILFRQNHSWQGKLRRPDTKQEYTFCSVLEMVLLIETLFV